jgi:hypothetical protein
MFSALGWSAALWFRALHALHPVQQVGIQHVCIHPHSYTVIMHCAHTTIHALHPVQQHDRALRDWPHQVILILYSIPLLYTPTLYSYSILLLHTPTHTPTPYSYSVLLLYTLYYIILLVLLYAHTALILHSGPAPPASPWCSGIKPRAIASHRLCPATTVARRFPTSTAGGSFSARPPSLGCSCTCSHTQGLKMAPPI